jgi:proliferating cell nuclear antigen
MFEARLTQGKVFKQLIEALKDLVQEANIDCSDDEISIQAMDNSHVSLVAVSLRSGGFDHFRCDRPISLGFNATNMGKILKCAGNDDIITLKAKDDGDALELVFESPGQDRIADFGKWCLIYVMCYFLCGVVYYRVVKKVVGYCCGRPHITTCAMSFILRFM